MSCLGHIICALCNSFENINPEGNWIAEKNESVKFFYKQITEGKNHWFFL